MEITINIKDKNPFNQKKKEKQLQILADLDCSILEKIVQLKNSKNGIKMFTDNWDLIEEMSK